MCACSIVVETIFCAWEVSSSNPTNRKLIIMYFKFQASLTEYSSSAPEHTGTCTYMLCYELCGKSVFIMTTRLRFFNLSTFLNRYGIRLGKRGFKAQVWPSIEGLTVVSQFMMSMSRGLLIHLTTGVKNFSTRSGRFFFLFNYFFLKFRDYCCVFIRNPVEMMKMKSQGNRKEKTPSIKGTSMTSL